METQTDQRTVIARQAAEFCLQPDSLAGADYASSRKHEYCDNDEMRQSWLYVEKMCGFFGFAEFPTNSGKNPIAFVADNLGANVALKLYRYYLNQCDKHGGPKSSVLTLVEFSRIIWGSALTDLTHDEGQKLYTLTRELNEGTPAR